MDFDRAEVRRSGQPLESRTGVAPAARVHPASRPRAGAQPADRAGLGHGIADYDRAVDTPVLNLRQEDRRRCRRSLASWLACGAWLPLRVRILTKSCRSAAAGLTVAIETAARRKTDECATRVTLACIASAVLVLAASLAASRVRTSRCGRHRNRDHQGRRQRGDRPVPAAVQRQQPRRGGAGAVRLAEAYQKRGDAEAHRVYERIVREFGDQRDAVVTAAPDWRETAEARFAAWRPEWRSRRPDITWGDGTFTGRRFISYTIGTGLKPDAARSRDGERSAAYSHDGWKPLCVRHLT